MVRVRPHIWRVGSRRSGDRPDPGGTADTGAERDGGLVLLSSVVTDPRRRPIATDHARCPGADPGCTCAGDQAVHAARAQPGGGAPSGSGVPDGADALVDCPECGEPSSPLRIVTWGHCRVCRTADSRSKSPLRW
ncbi:hypothetical protein GCM10023328_23620 [Modestobacter marinus]|uniref:Uncharacterized protein n=1 Tax=Modestobacter marinus TaxID=477641 RepID=A0ABQ2FXC5_9ACTN|nr:hypothetical protein GCM10011589_19260 [Modestobacter marinus]